LSLKHHELGEANMIKKYLLAALAMVFAHPLLCGAEGRGRDYWPTKEWRYSSPEKQGLNSSILENMEKYISNTLSATDSVLIVRHGYLLFEKYSGRTSEEPKILMSVTKSVISALLGIAIDKGLVKSIDQKMMEFFPDIDSKSIDDSVREITLRHLLTMSANIHAYTAPNYLRVLFEEPLTREPGKSFAYNDSDPQIISMIITKVSSLSAANFAREYLFKPIGVETYYWEELGDYSSGHSGLSLRPRDMARLGYLYLNKGRWDGKQIVSEKWINESTQNQISGLIAGEYADSYGYYWWLDKVNENKFYLAEGYGGQVIAVLPDLDIVFVTTASGYDYSASRSLLENYVIPAVMK